MSNLPHGGREGVWVRLHVLTRQLNKPIHGVVSDEVDKSARQMQINVCPTEVVCQIQNDILTLEHLSLEVNDGYAVPPSIKAHHLSID